MGAPPVRQEAAIEGMSSQHEGTLTAVVSPASVWSVFGLRAMRESARGEPIAVSGLEGPILLSASRTSVRIDRLTAQCSEQSSAR
jgi:hypothetical protein